MNIKKEILKLDFISFSPLMLCVVIGVLWFFLDGPGATRVGIQAGDRTGRGEELPELLAENLSSHPGAETFVLNWSAMAGTAQGTGKEIYDRQKGTLTEIWQGCDSNGEWRDYKVFSGVTDDRIRQLARDRRIFTDLPRYGSRPLIVPKTHLMTKG